MTNFPISSKKLIIIFACILVIFAFLSYTTSEEEYSIPQVIKYVYVNNDSSCIIEEDTNYTFKDVSGHITKNITLDGGQKASNIKVETPGLYHDVKIDNSTKNISISVNLYKNPEKTQKVSNQNAKVIYQYRLSNILNAYDDIVEFKYNTWNKDEGRILKLESYIFIPDSKDNVILWNNPPYRLTSDSWVNKTVYEARYKPITQSDEAQIRILMPKEYFSSYDYANIIHNNSKDSIIVQQNNYQSSIDFNYTSTYLFIAISIILIILPGIIYYGSIKQSKIKDSSNIWGKIPYDTDPVFVNMIFRKDDELVNLNAFYATLYSLIDKGVLEMIPEKEASLIKNTEITSNLKKYETSLLSYLDDLSDDEGYISIGSLDESRDEFKNFIDSWKREASNEFSTDKCYTNKYSLLFRKTAVISLVYAILVLAYLSVMNPDVSSIDLAFKTAFVLIPISLLSYYVGVNNKRQLSDTAVEYMGNWKLFEKYVNDYALIKNYPPNPDNINRYIMYATALGSYNSFKVNMLRYIKEEAKCSEDILRFFIL